ncbi:hypothetical protein KEM55_008651, partial [Ascosphaera atra]
EAIHPVYKICRPALRKKAVAEATWHDCVKSTFDVKGENTSDLVLSPGMPNIVNKSRCEVGGGTKREGSELMRANQL